MRSRIRISVHFRSINSHLSPSPRPVPVASGILTSRSRSVILSRVTTKIRLLEPVARFQHELISLPYHNVLVTLSFTSLSSTAKYFMRSFFFLSSFFHTVVAYCILHFNRIIGLIRSFYSRHFLHTSHIYVRMRAHL